MMTDPRPILLLTRPHRQAEVFAQSVVEELGDCFDIVVSPLLRIEGLPGSVDLDSDDTLIFSSVNGVEAYRPMHDGRSRKVFCVGERTAQAARSLGLSPIEWAPDAGTLLDLIEAKKPAGRFKHLHGEHTRGDIAPTLAALGYAVSEAVIYRQIAQPLTAEAREALSGAQPVCVPVFSPRTAELLTPYLLRAAAPLTLIALSSAVSERLPRGATVAATPNAAAMVHAIATCTTLEGKGLPS